MLAYLGRSLCSEVPVPLDSGTKREKLHRPGGGCAAKVAKTDLERLGLGLRRGVIESILD